MTGTAQMKPQDMKPFGKVCLAKTESFVFRRMTEISARYNRQIDRTGAARFFFIGAISIQNMFLLACRPPARLPPSPHPSAARRYESTCGESAESK